MVFPGIDKIIYIPGIVQMIEWIAIREADQNPAFPDFTVCIHIASKRIKFFQKPAVENSKFKVDPMIHFEL